MYLFLNQLVKTENMTSVSKMCVLTGILEMHPIAVFSIKLWDHHLLDILLFPLSRNQLLASLLTSSVGTMYDAIDNPFFHRIIFI